MIDSLTKLAPQPVITELLRLARKDKDWATFYWAEKGETGLKPLPEEDAPLVYKGVTHEFTDSAEGFTQEMRCHLRISSWLRELFSSTADVLGMYSLSQFLINGPKLFRPTVQQCEALEQIEVPLLLKEYTQPFPAIVIDFPDDRYAPFIAALCYQCDQFVVIDMHTRNHMDDIVISMVNPETPMEITIFKYDEDCEELAQISGKAARVAINSCLALTNFGCQSELMFPKQVESDRKLAGEQSERGMRARDRLKLAFKTIRFNHEVKLHKTVGRSDKVGDPTYSISPHWRRGYWRMQPYGPNNMLRKRILIPPVLVRADLFAGELADTVTKYKG